MSLFRLLASLLCLLYEAPAVAAAPPRDVDLELVLAIDASGSVDEEEFKLQLAGIAAAFRDQDVQAAVASGPRGRIAVAIVIWADASTPKDQTDWYLLASPADCNAFAIVVDEVPRRVEGGTGIGSAVAHSIRLMEYNDISAPRRVVDVSGDGIETPVREDIGILLPSARNMADALQVVVNGLAITNEVLDLDIYFRDNMITGPGSFVMKAKDYLDFREAIRAKLLREIAANVATAPVRPIDRRFATELSMAPAGRGSL